MEAEIRAFLDNKWWEAVAPNAPYQDLASTHSPEEVLIAWGQLEAGIYAREADALQIKKDLIRKQQNAANHEKAIALSVQATMRELENNLFAEPELAVTWAETGRIFPKSAGFSRQRKLPREAVIASQMGPNATRMFANAYIQSGTRDMIPLQLWHQEVSYEYHGMTAMSEGIVGKLPDQAIVRIKVWTVQQEDPIESFVTKEEIEEWGGLQGVITPPIGDKYIGAVEIVDAADPDRQVYYERRSSRTASVFVLKRKSAKDDLDPTKFYRERQLRADRQRKLDDQLLRDGPPRRRRRIK